MDLVNETSVQEFILLGFGEDQPRRFLFFVFFTTLYVFAFVENLTVIMLVRLDTCLAQLPMYILLSNFSWVEICYMSATVPRILFDLASHQGTISFHACLLQFYILFSLGTTEFFFLSVMALDRYLAICHPLRYRQLMSCNSCYFLVASCWVFGFLGYILPVTSISRLSFCGSNVIDHFMCDPMPILSLACPPLGHVPLICQIVMHFTFIGNVLFVAFSYSLVIWTLMKSSNKESCKKAFSTVTMHLLVVTLFYSSVGGMYLIPGGKNKPEIAKAMTVFYTAVTPFVNPLIYCLRNSQVKEALGRVLRRGLGMTVTQVIGQ